MGIETLGPVLHPYVRASIVRICLMGATGGVLGKKKLRISGISDTNTSTQHTWYYDHHTTSPSMGAVGEVGCGCSDLGLLFVLDAPRLLTRRSHASCASMRTAYVYVWEATRQIRCHGH